MSIRRRDLQPASYNGVTFHIENNTRASGRRVALHEFPKRDIPYAEDMGRKARRFSIVAYVIGLDFRQRRDALIEQLEAEGNGQLYLPTDQTFDDKKVVVEGYSVSEKREQGYYAEFEITFIEAGEALFDRAGQNTQAAVSQQANATIGAGNGVGTAFDIAQQYISGSAISGVSNFIDQFASFAGIDASLTGVLGSVDFGGW